MQIYLAPMEGLTSYVYRNAYQKCFHEIDKFFTPFICDRKLNYKEKNDVIPEHNLNIPVVPQILTNHAEVFLSIAGRLELYGYQSVNLNLGCPSGTVVAKYRGSGFLALPEELDRFLDTIFTRCNLKISIKTRIGRDSPEEWDSILRIYKAYPLEELIVHPRIQKDYYKNTPNWEAFRKAEECGAFPVCYNGDITSVPDYKKWQQAFPQTGTIMLGRGILANPGLAGELRGRAGISKGELWLFHQEILEGYQKMMPGDRATLFRMKELWSYMVESFTEPKKYWKKIKKADCMADYIAVVKALIDEQELVNRKDASV